MLDALSLKNTRLGLETLELMGYDHDRIRVVLNRANTSVGITRTDVVNILGRTPDILSPATVTSRAPSTRAPRSCLRSSARTRRSAFESLADLSPRCR